MIYTAQFTKDGRHKEFSMTVKSSFELLQELQKESWYSGGVGGYRLVNIYRTTAKGKILPATQLHEMSLKQKSALGYAC